MSSNSAAALIFGARQPRLINPSGHTPIGNMTGGGNLAAGFDGNLDQAAAACAQGGGAVTRYIGLTFASPQYVSGYRYIGSNDNGIALADVTVSVQVWAKNGAAPSSDTDGTYLGENDPAAVADAPSLVMQNQFLTAGTWDHVWARVISTASTTTKYCAEVQFYTL